MCCRAIRLRSSRLGARAVDRPNRNGYGTQLTCDDCAYASLFRASRPRRDAPMEQTRSEGLWRVGGATCSFVSRRHFRETLTRAHEAIGG
jgi:hypothetical protein